MISKQELDRIKHALEYSLAYHKKKKAVNTQIAIYFNVETAKNLYDFLDSVEEIRCDTIMQRDWMQYVPPADLDGMAKADIADSMAKHLQNEHYIRYLISQDATGDQKMRGSLFVIKPKEDDNHGKQA